MKKFFLFLPAATVGLEVGNPLARIKALSMLLCPHAKCHRNRTDFKKKKIVSVLPRLLVKLTIQNIEITDFYKIKVTKKYLCSPKLLTHFVGTFTGRQLELQYITEAI